jgi:hypothetical protein
MMPCYYGNILIQLFDYISIKKFVDVKEYLGVDISQGLFSIDDLISKRINLFGNHH